MTRGPTAANMHVDEHPEFAQASLTSLSTAGLAGGGIWYLLGMSIAANTPGSLSTQAFLAPSITLMIVSGSCLLFKLIPITLRIVIFLIGLTGVIFVSYFLSGTLIWLCFLSLIVIIAGLLVGAWTSVASAIVLTLTVLLMPQWLPFALPWAGTLLILIMLWSATLTAALSSHGFYTALRWTEESERNAIDLLVELRKQQGELNHTLAALTEATRRLERINQELGVARQRAEEARALKEQFVANVSHELRTPLNLIVGFTEMMYLEPESYPGAAWTTELRSDLGELFRASQHLQSLINDILDLSRIDASRLPMYRELHDIRTIVSDAVETLAPLLHQHRLTYLIHWPETLPKIFVDRTRIRQVLLNLLNNAVRFTDEGSISISGEEKEGAIVVAVHDTGIGIPNEELKVIFEEFRQLDPGLRGRGGAGLGLALSRQFVELHGGQMWAESEVGMGSTFFFSLPLPGAVAQTMPIVESPGRKHVSPSTGPVLIIDSDPTIATMLSRYLGDWQVCSATTPTEAEALVETLHPQAVIVNQSPDTITEAWLGALGPCSKRYDVPVFRCSIPSSSWLKQSTGLDDCLSKPITREELGAVVSTYCQETSTILVVDDNTGFVSLIVRMLGLLNPNYRVLTAYSGAEGMRLAREAAPSLVLLDLLLPDMDGFTVLAALRADPALEHTRVVAVTATSYAEEALKRKGGFFTLTHMGGLSTGILTELLNATLRIVQPDYTDGDDEIVAA
jgi:signal transduction histidine kinase/CheY-like chemotaxis protein